MMGIKGWTEINIKTCRIFILTFIRSYVSEIDIDEQLFMDLVTVEIIGS